MSGKSHIPRRSSRRLPYIIRKICQQFLQNSHDLSHAIIMSTIYNTITKIYSLFLYTKTTKQDNNTYNKQAKTITHQHDNTPHQAPSRSLILVARVDSTGAGQPVSRTDPWAGHGQPGYPTPRPLKPVVYVSKIIRHWKRRDFTKGYRGLSCSPPRLHA
jgi:hypothetical protein